MNYIESINKKNILKVDACSIKFMEQASNFGIFVLFLL